MIITNDKILESLEEKDVNYIKQNGTIEIPNSIRVIGEVVFYRNILLHEIIIPNSVIEIGDYSFRLCDSLNKLVIGKNVEKIGKYAFAYCDSLSSVFIPKSVKTIDECAFLSFGDLKIYCEETSKPEGWDKNWNPNNRPVIWGYKGENYEKM